MDHSKDGTRGCIFVPFSVRTYGGLELESYKLLKDMANKAASARILGKCVRLQWIGNEIVESDYIGERQDIREFIGCLISGGEQHHKQGDDIPALDI
jgi:hypothetical protein